MKLFNYSVLDTENATLLSAYTLGRLDFLLLQDPHRRILLPSIPSTALCGTFIDGAYLLGHHLILKAAETFKVFDLVARTFVDVQPQVHTTHGKTIPYLVFQGRRFWYSLLQRRIVEATPYLMRSKSDDNLWEEISLDSVDRSHTIVFANPHSAWCNVQTSPGVWAIVDDEYDIFQWDGNTQTLSSLCECPRTESLHFDNGKLYAAGRYGYNGYFDYATQTFVTDGVAAIREEDTEYESISVTTSKGQPCLLVSGDCILPDSLTSTFDALPLDFFAQQLTALQGGEIPEVLIPVLTDILKPLYEQWKGEFVDFAFDPCYVSDLCDEAKARLTAYFSKQFSEAAL